MLIVFVLYLKPVNDNRWLGAPTTLRLSWSRPPGSMMRRSKAWPFLLHIYIYIERERDRYVSLSLSLSLYIYIYIHLYLCTYGAGRRPVEGLPQPAVTGHWACDGLLWAALPRVCHRLRENRARFDATAMHRTANLHTKILDFGGIDSSIILILWGGILRSIWDFPESLSQRILVG